MNNGSFKPGKDSRRNTKGGSKGPRTLAVERLDKLLKKAKTTKAIDAALLVKFNRDVFWFWLNVIVPLAPKQASSDAEAVGFAAMTPAQACAAMDEATSPKEPDVK